MGEYRIVSGDVIHCLSENRYFLRVVSAKGLQRKFLNGEAEYEISTQDIKIELATRESVHRYTDGILLTLCCENLAEESGEVIKTSFIEVIVSDMLGTFVSDWH